MLLELVDFDIIFLRLRKYFDCLEVVRFVYLDLVSNVGI